MVTDIQGGGVWMWMAQGGGDSGRVDVYMQHLFFGICTHNVDVSNNSQGVY